MKSVCGCIFLSLIGAKTYGLLRDLIAPAKPKEKSLAELTKTLRTHFEPRPLIIAERFHFNQRNQLPNESIADYMAIRYAKWLRAANSKIS